MKKFAADNLMFLRDQYPEIYKLVRNRDRDRERFAPDLAKNNQANMEVTHGDSRYHLYSKYDPNLEVTRWTESISSNVSDSQDVLLIGFGLGYHAAAFIEAFPDKKLYIYEPNIEMLLAAIESVDLRPILNGYHIAMFAVGEDESVFTELLVGMYRKLKGKFNYLIIPPYKKLMPELDAQLAKMIPSIARSFRMDLNTIEHFRLEWIDNILLNTARVLKTPSFYPLKNICADLPVVIVGSGPSLDLEAERLRKLKDHALIIAAGTSTQGLLHRGIEPHLIVSIDPGVANRTAFIDLDVAHIPFLFVSMIKHSAIRHEDSPYLFHGFFDIDVLSSYLMDLRVEDGVLASTSSVTGTAIQLAAFMGASEIVFIGQDLSYPGDRIYAEGVDHTHQGWEQEALGAATLKVRNVNGGFNRSTPNMNTLKSDIESVIRAFPDMEFYNASPVGAEIEHTSTKSFECLLAERQGRVLPANWFKDQMQQKLKLYPDERKFAVIHRIETARENAVGIYEKVNQVKSLLKDNKLDLKRWFDEFDARWSSIINHQLYEKVFSFFLMNEQNHAQKYWGEMYAETRLDVKRAKLEKTIEPLLKGMDTIIPPFIYTSLLLLNKLEMKG